ncbi:radical SAM family heme chaperone HemW [Buchnera aphidicola]|uniref:radical SAM family heme chaperone HemW n=1 Tax=Buchnera aphidicola TaxID=9 RepID=UPI00094C204C|nr:radical SAM family heme chaperone HemW [Buchnera aphidicola]
MQINKKNLLPPLSLYIHIPWCIKKCPYCDFHSLKNAHKISEKKYLRALIKDLRNDQTITSKRPIQSIFIGGGTPSLLKTTTIRNLIKKIKKITFISKKVEISIEINPDIDEQNKLIKYIKYGINRLSIGVQTFNDYLLKQIQREYTKQKSIDLIQLTRNILNRNLNIDIIYGLPKQSIQDALNDLKTTIDLKPEHISWYQLDVEPNTKFYIQDIKLPSISKIEKIHQEGQKILKQAGYTQYEISSYARKKKYQCIHNLNYWNFGDYIGIGCGAHGKITQKDQQVMRLIKTKSDAVYAEGLYLQKKYTVPKKNLPLEFFLNQFRLLKPILYKDFETMTQINKKKIEKKILTATIKKYLTSDDCSWKVTNYGRKKLNSLLSLFL